MFTVNSWATKILSYIAALVIGFTSGYTYCQNLWKANHYEQVVESQQKEIKLLSAINTNNANIIESQNLKIQKSNDFARKLQYEISKKDDNLRKCTYTSDQLRIMADSANGYSLQDARGSITTNGESATTTNDARIYTASDGVKLLIEHDRICHLYIERVSAWNKWYSSSQSIVESSNREQVH